MSEKDGFGAKWYEQRMAQRQRHAERPTPGKVAAALNFYSPEHQRLRNLAIDAGALFIDGKPAEKTDPALLVKFYAPPGTRRVDRNLNVIDEGDPVRDGDTYMVVNAPLVDANVRRETGLDEFVALCLADGLPEPVREYPFHGTRKWRFDYAWPRFRVAVEREGGIWSSVERAKMAHSLPLAILRDMAKGNAAAILGWRVLRYTPEQLLQGAVAELKGLLA